MVPARHRLIPLHDAMAEFGLQALFHRDGGYDAMEDTVNPPEYGSPPMALVFDGDTRLAETFDAGAAFHKRQGLMDGPITPLEELLGRACTVVVNGSLQAPRIDTRGCQALFVFGSVRCGAIEFWQGDFVWIAGDLNATRAVLATAGHDDPDRADYVGRSYACVQAPRVQTWFMGQGHLNWREGSGGQFCEGVEYTDQDHLWKTDPVWLRRNGIDDALGACA
ncbi:hypothetical protein GmRootA79_53320 (plasmid) [Acidovorax sp. A79]|uniref:hypothetical protein n=1 Tax=Acidovorax sp. A79 TaxID=3056107 RepID=UPI0034E847D6